MTRKVEITGAPGYVDGFKATLVPGLDHVQVSANAPEVSVVVTDAGETLAIPSEFVHDLNQPLEAEPREALNAELYADEWVAKTGRARSDIYIPEALR